MNAPLLLCRVGYMTAYDGIGHIVNGGAEIERLGMGGEMWNFRVENRRCYGYAMSVGFAGVNLNRLLGGVARSRGDKGTGIDVIFFATKPGVGQVVIGWYLNATSFTRNTTCAKRRLWTAIGQRKYTTYAEQMPGTRSC